MNSEEMKKNFETNKKIRIGVLTWNLAGNLPPTNFDASKVLLPETLQQEMSLFNKPDEVDLYVVGLQEMVNLEFIGSLVCTKDEGRMLQWEYIIRTGLKKRMPDRNFTCVQRKVMFGCYVMLFVREDHQKSIKKTASCKIKTGAAGIAANKGSTSLRFNYDDTSFMFLNCHLTSGQKQWQDRLDDLRLCYEETLYNFNQSIGEDATHKFLLGDMNWRIELPYDQAVASANHNQLEYLQKFDQLLKHGPRNPLTAQFSEGPLNFKPTYKYDDNSDVYDTSKKMRVPSWTDRILYTQQGSELVYYGRRENKFSDHRPVLAVFEVTVKRTDTQVKLQLLNEQTERLMKSQQLPGFTSNRQPEMVNLNEQIKVDHEYLMNIMLPPQQPLKGEQDLIDLMGFDLIDVSKNHTPRQQPDLMKKHSPPKLNPLDDLLNMQPAQHILKPEEPFEAWFDASHFNQKEHNNQNFFD